MNHPQIKKHALDDGEHDEQLRKSPITKSAHQSIAQGLGM